MAIGIGPTDFSWLGDLPSIYDQARIKGAQQDVLSSLDPSSPKSLDEHARQLFSVGDFQGGAALMNASLQRRELARKIAYDQQYMMQLPSLMGALGRGPSTVIPPTGEGGPPANIVGGAPPTSASPFPPGPTPFSPNLIPATPGPQTSVPPSLGGSDRPTLADLKPMSPSDEIISRAQGAPQAPPMPQYAQAGGTPALPSWSVPPSAPSSTAGGLPQWLYSGAAVPPNSDLGTTGQPPQIPGLPIQEQALRDAKYWASKAAGIGPHNPAGIAAIRPFLANALERAKLTQPQFDWTMDQYDRQARGEKLQSYSDWQAEQKVLPETYKAALGAYDTVQKKVGTALAFDSTINTLNSIINNPKMVSGEGTAYFEYGKKVLRNAMDGAIAQGIPVPQAVVDMVNKGTTSVQLRDAFQALSNTSIFDRLGSLGNQISEGDRNFVSASFPNLAFSKESNKLLIEYYKAIVDQQKEIGKLVNGVRKDMGPRVTDVAINEKVQNYVESHPIAFDKDGNPTTDLGKRLKALNDAEAAKTPAQGVVPQAQGVVPPVPTQGPAAPRAGSIVNQGGKRYRILPDGSGEELP